MLNAENCRQLAAKGETSGPRADAVTQDRISEGLSPREVAQASLGEGAAVSGLPSEWENSLPKNGLI